VGFHRVAGWSTQCNSQGSVKVLDDEHVVFADLFSRKTRENLQKNSKVAVTVVDEKTYTGYQLKARLNCS